MRVFDALWTGVNALTLLDPSYSHVDKYIACLYGESSGTYGASRLIEGRFWRRF